MNKKDTNEAIDVKIEYIKADVQEVKSDVKDIKSNYLTRREFEEWANSTVIPLRNGFFGMIALIVTGFFGAVINFFIKKP